MICSLYELRNKEIIDIKTGAKIGYVDDIEINTETAMVIALIVYGRPRFFGLFGRDDDMLLKCKEIEVIGEDTILVRFAEEDTSYVTKKSKKKSFGFESLCK